MRKKQQYNYVGHVTIAGSCFQVICIINIILLFTLFQKTKSLTYSIVISCFNILFIVLDLIPRLSKKYQVFIFIGVVETLILICTFICLKLIIDNYLVFNGYCSDLVIYYQERRIQSTIKDQTLFICSQIIIKFVAQITVEVVIAVGKIIHVFFYRLAYKQAKNKFQEDERKKKKKNMLSSEENNRDMHLIKKEKYGKNL